MDARVTDHRATRPTARTLGGISSVTFQRILGVLLILAAGLKAIDGFGLVVIVTAVAEVLLGLWLLACVRPVAARCAAGSCFMAFLAVSLAKALAGESSCGCFGRLAVDPWLTAGFDAAVVACLGMTLPLRSLTVRWTTACFAVAIAACVGGVTHLVSVAPRHGEVAAEPIDPRSWLGRPFDDSAVQWQRGKIDEGEWYVAFSRSECATCRQEIERLREVVSRTQEGPAASVAVIEASSGEAVGDGRLRPGSRLAAPTPLILRVRDGTVVGYAHTADVAWR